MYLFDYLKILYFSTNLTDPETASVASKRSKTSTKSKSSNADVKLSQSQAGSQAGDEEEQGPPPRKTKMIIEQRSRVEIEAYIETILYVSERRVPEEKVILPLAKTRFSDRFSN